MLDVSQDDITGGSLPRALVYLAAPLVVQQLVHVVNQVVDTIWVGRIGEGAAAAVGLSIPIMAVFFTVLANLRVGTQVLVSQRVGDDRHDEARRATANGVLLGLAVGLVLTLTLRTAAPLFVDLLGVQESVAPLAITYFTTIALLFPMEGVSNAIEAGFVGWGESRVSMVSNVVFVITNLVLDPILIFGIGPAPALGLQGAALAMVSGSAAGLLVAGAFALVGRDGFQLDSEVLDVVEEDYRETADIALPKIGQGVGRQLAGVAVVSIVSIASGAAGLAAFLVGTRVTALATVPVQGLSQASQSVIGQNVGAKNAGRARRTTWIAAAIAFAVLAVASAVQWFAPGTIARVFVPNMDGRALALSVDYLRILALGVPAVGLVYVFTAGFDGASRTKVSMVVRLAQYWGVRVPVAAVGAFLLGYGVYGAFWGVTLSNVVAAVGAGAYYHYSTGQGMLDRAVTDATATGD